MPTLAPPDSHGIVCALSVERSGFRLDVELQIRGQGITALFGASGAGKTSLLRLIAGLERGRGSLYVLGECWQDDAKRIFVPVHRRALGYVFQEASLFPHLSVRENLGYAQKRRHSEPASVPFEGVVDLLGIAPLLARMPATLSGGERQRAAIARALLATPRLLLMDEPLAALDAARKADVLPYLERLRAELSIPILYVSHALDEVARLADNLVLLQHGSVVAAGPLGDLLSRLDLPLAVGEQAGVVIEARVAVHDAQHALTRLDFGDSSLWVSALNQPIGARSRARVLARDVSLALSPPGPSSILNVLSARITELRDQGPDRVNVRLLVGSGEAPLLARVTRRSRDELGLRPGLTVYALVKSVSVTA